MKICDEANEIIQKIRELDAIRKKFSEEKNKDLEIIEKKYDPLFKKIAIERNKTTDKLAELNEKVEELSTFNSDEIGPTLAKLISWYEDDKYIYQVVPYNVTEVHYERYGTDIYEIKYLASLIAKKSYAQKEYSDRYVPEVQRLPLKKSDYHILLCLENDKYLNKSYDDKNITFYSNALKLKIFKEEYPYINDFINYLVDYKMENNINNIPKNEYDSLLNSFEENYEKKDSIVKAKMKKLIK